MVHIPILEAIYRNEDIEEKVTVDSIEKYHNFQEVKRNIYCTYDNCPSKLEYVPKGKRKAHFKTWPKDNHIQECVDFFEREKKSRSERNSATQSMALSDKHVSRILNELKRKQEQKENGQSTAIKSNRKKKQATVDTTQPTSSTTNIVATTGGNADLQEGEGNGKVKAPSVRTRNLTLLNSDDVGFTRSLYEVKIIDVMIDEERVVLSVSNGNKTCKIYYEEYFFGNAPVNFMNRFVQLRKIVESNKELDFTCVGMVVERENGFHILINRANDFRVNHQYLTLFIDSYLNGRI